MSVTTEHIDSLTDNLERHASEEGEAIKSLCAQLTVAQQQPQVAQAMLIAQQAFIADALTISATRMLGLVLQHIDLVAISYTFRSWSRLVATPRNAVGIPPSLPHSPVHLSVEAAHAAIEREKRTHLLQLDPREQLLIHERTTLVNAERAAHHRRSAELTVLASELATLKNTFAAASASGRALHIASHSATPLSRKTNPRLAAAPPPAAMLPNPSNLLAAAKVGDAVAIATRRYATSRLELLRQAQLFEAPLLSGRANATPETLLLRGSKGKDHPLPRDLLASTAMQSASARLLSSAH